MDKSRYQDRKRMNAIAKASKGLATWFVVAVVASAAAQPNGAMIEGKGAGELPVIEPASLSVVSNAVAAALQADTHVSGWYNELVKLARGGIETGVLLAYVDNTPGTFNLGPEEIINLRDLGVSNDVITSALQHDQEIKSGARFLPASTVPQMSLPRAITDLAAVPVSTGSPTPAPAALVESETTPTEPTLAMEAAELIPVASREGASTYPVREPYPVRLTAPILMVNSAARLPNVFVIERLR
jgi:hypothetical protein